MGPTAGLEQAIAATRSALTGVTPEQLAATTPCASWTVRELVNHVVGAQYFFTAHLTGAAPAGEAPDFAAGDFVAAFDQGAAACVAAFSAEGVLSKMVKLPFGEMPGGAVLGLACTDTLVHGWDVAKATGQSTDLAPELATQLLAQAKVTIPSAMRGPDGKAPFGPEQTAPEGAAALDQLAAFLGRAI